MPAVIIQSPSVPRQFPAEKTLLQSEICQMQVIVILYQSVKDQAPAVIGVPRRVMNPEQVVITVPLMVNNQMPPAVHQSP